MDLKLKKYLPFGVLSILLAYGCAEKQSQNNGGASEELNSIITSVQDHEGYDEESYPLGLFTEEHYKSEADFARGKLEELQAIATDDLKETDRISVELLKYVLQQRIDFYEFEAYLNPLLSDAGFHNSLPYMARKLTNYKQVREYLNKLNALPVFVDQHLVNLRRGLEKGVSQPKVIFKGYESTYNDHIVESAEESFYYSPFKELPVSLSEEQKDSVLTAAREAINSSVVPQFKRIKEFFETEYLPNTRDKLGVSTVPNGEAYYQNQIKRYTTLDLSPDEIHQIGLEEVARIRSEMEAIIKEVNFKGSFADFLLFLRTDKQFYPTSAEALLKEARDISKRIDAQLPRYFITLPRKPYGVAPVPTAIAPKYTTGRYIGTEKNSTEPGYYWVNTYNLSSRPLYALPSLTAHEAVPGHHLQGSLNKELGDSIPQFRKNLYISAFGEGWGLYSEYLGEEMGIYRTPYERFGKLTYEMWRACRLVVDTGIHAKNWSREQAVEFMSTNSALSLHNINTEVDRYISWPAQALSYKLGEIKIRELREKATEELGSKFDIREFHEVILEQGTVTLAILEERINNYIEKKKNE
ncbi:DUF885 family protein [Leptobacterium flavescens]|uniref:DUF885 family protein n=1 Tax=Leptobacterium flavescens TaxID=472055 RepID=A0A6P0UK72_9FLAO|nr:DUF885 domain-containing protein [Leptobacterium flavescens]NER12810.1 DUF885 family protein [Leptobacterium flavescens]